MARAKAPAKPAAPPGIGAGARVGIFLAIAVVGVIAVGVGDVLRPMQQPTIAALCVGVVAAGAVFALTTPWRYAVVAALLVGLAAGWITYSPSAQRKVEVGWGKAAHGIDKLFHRSDGPAKAAGR